VAITSKPTSSTQSGGTTFVPTARTTLTNPLTKSPVTPHNHAPVWANRIRTAAPRLNSTGEVLTEVSVDLDFGGTILKEGTSAIEYRAHAGSDVWHFFGGALVPKSLISWFCITADRLMVAYAPSAKHYSDKSAALIKRTSTASRDALRLQKNKPSDGHRMRRAQNRRSQLPQRYCLIDTNRNNLSSKSWRRDRLITLLLQFGHVITRKRLYSLIEWVQIPILIYRLSPQKRRPHFVQLYGLIQTNLSSFSRKFRRCERTIIVLLLLGQVMTAMGRSSHTLSRSVGDVSQHF